MMTEEKTQRGIGRGITLKQLGLILPLTFLFAASLAMGFYSMFNQRGDAKDINYTGQLRYRSYQLATQVNVYPALQGGARDGSRNVILGLIEEFETILYGLRDGNKALGLKGFKMPQNMEEGLFSYDDPWWQFDRHVQDFQNRIKPLILHVLTLTGQEETRDALKIYNKEVPLFVGDMDRTVHLLQQLSERKIADFCNAEFIILGLFFTVVGVSFLLSMLFVQRPLVNILKGINTFSHGNLDHRIPVKGKDEIAVMARSFNAMAETIKKDRKEIEAGRSSLYEILGNIGCLVRVVNPRAHTVSFQNKPLQALFPQGLSSPCYSLLGRDKECDRCTSMEAIERNSDFSKEEKSPGDTVYEIHSFPLANPDGAITSA
ncbi:MAG: HAMP domain-containing protein, partial [Candidatus Brocadiales bacterium]|nr:HAMP domain-containing protein [Candidatus Brocadiales bacterium]